MTDQPTPELPKAYEPHQVEQKWYAYWMQQGYFTPKIDPSKKPFVIIQPPPNITGDLHLGHALTATLEDIMVRWHRMLGEPTLWLPGEDHAGIAAQVVVERALAKEGLTRHQIGREKFNERMWQWVDGCRANISNQHKRLGVSCDWTRERFTLDPGPSRAVRTFFVNLYEKGLIYRGERIINWCARCATALSDLEVEHEDVSSHLWYIKYPLEDGSGFITVATTRPETMLGDTAVAVNPADERYQDLISKNVRLPLMGRIIPIIADESVSTEFGTGAVKVTPAHDPSDFEIGLRHNPPVVNILANDVTINENGGKFRGMDRFDARKAVVAELESKGLLEKIEPHTHAVGHCQRCRTIIEPIASRQWFVKIAPLSAPAIEAVKSGQISIVPERFTKVYLNWMENIRDWCISRQLWWGHRIPVWYCVDCDGDNIVFAVRGKEIAEWQRQVGGTARPPLKIGNYKSLLEDSPQDYIASSGEIVEIRLGVQPIVQVNEPKTCPRCGRSHLIQDPDVLDTWFSSGLWTHSTLGWPDKTTDMEYFYPTSVMETAYDILFFWVARMIMMGIENMGEPPFRYVYLHGLIRDEKGDKMSKTKGNVIDPLEVMDKYGTDALRFAIITGTTPGNDSKLSASKLEAGRNFANKLWNAARFVLRYGGKEGVDATINISTLALEDRWIISRLNSTVAEASELMQEFEFGEALRRIHDFLWGEYCDWYIELAKARLADKFAASPLPVLVRVLETSLRMLHPYMPFVTEELWHNLNRAFDLGCGDSIMVSSYPQAAEMSPDIGAELVIDSLVEIVRSVRNTRAEYDVEVNRLIEASIYAGELAPLLKPYAGAIETLARARVTIESERSGTVPPQALVLVLETSEVVIPMASMFDLRSEMERITRETAEAVLEIGRLETLLGDKAFCGKAPAAVVEKQQEKLTGAREKLARLKEHKERLAG
ncbi:MAG: valine--tRNA ligase [Dehalococcoidales bacterium]